MHVALTGISGFIGSVIARHLHDTGHTVTGLVRSSSRRDHIEPYVSQLVVGDQHDDRVWPALLDGADAVIHNSVDWRSLKAGDIDQHFTSNLLGSVRLLEASGDRQFIFISSIAVHHDMHPNWNGTVDATHPLRPGNLYGALKAAVEAHLWARHFSRGQHVCSIRPTAVYGVDPTLTRSIGYPFIEQLRAGEPFSRAGGGKFVHVDDVAALAVATLGNGNANGRAFNMADCYARWSDLARMVADHLSIVDFDIDDSSPSEPKNTFTKDDVQSLGVEMSRGHDGIRSYLADLISVVDAQTQASA